MQINDLNELLKKYAEGKCTDEERRIVEQLYDNAYNSLDERPISDERSAALFTKITEQLSRAREQHEINTRYRWLAAAGILIFIGLGLWLGYRNIGTKTKPKTFIAQNDLHPGTNKATLILANGQKIILDDAAKGTVAKQGAVKIIKLNDGEVKYTAQHDGKSIAGLNTITTPAGGKYRLVLPDGTNVWLNAQSSLQFPSGFTGAERDVTLTGEGYFEVAKNKYMPFKVKVGSNTIEVLGTHFNIMAYNNESNMKTTLLEGSVKISTLTSSEVLKPSQQASINGNNSLSIATVDVEPEVAWTNDLFWFSNSDIHTIMRQLARWYDVDVKYQGNVTQTFSGTIPRNINASKVFTVLQQTGGVHFQVQGKTVIVSP